jgi:DNA polymerase III epsilon subunit-like protein
MPNLVFLELDTTGLSLDAEIIHALVLDASGAVLLSVYARPSEPMSANIAHITGITNDVLGERGVSIAELIALVRDTLKGKYVLSYNLHFDANKLSETTTRLRQENIPIIGDDLMQQAMHYFGTSSYPKLELLCSSIGHPLPEHPHQLALDRARGQLALLNALATVVTDQNASPWSTGSSESIAGYEGDDLAEQDEPPF